MSKSMDPLFEPVDSKHLPSIFAIVVVFNDARKVPRVEKILEKYSKVKQRHYVGVENRYGTPVDRVAVYIVDSVISDRVIKSTLKNVETTGDIEVIIKKC